MNDLLQLAVVTAAAAAALAVLVRPYVRRAPAGPAPGCTTCPSKQARQRMPVSDVQPLRLIRR